MYARFLTLTHRMHREDSDSCAAALREVRRLNGQQRRTRIALIRVHRRLWGDELHVVGRTENARPYRRQPARRGLDDRHGRIDGAGGHRDGHAGVAEQHLNGQRIAILAPGEDGVGYEDSL